MNNNEVNHRFSFKQNFVQKIFPKPKLKIKILVLAEICDKILNIEGFDAQF